MFDEVITLFDRYCEAYATHQDFHLDLAAELKERLKQLNFTIKRVLDLELGDESQVKGTSNALGKMAASMIAAGSTDCIPAPPEAVRIFEQQVVHWNENSIELRIMAEAFYYFAERARKIATRTLPRLKKFESDGVRDVRNKLIEHPEQEEICAQNFGYGSSKGPVLKEVRRPDQGQDFPDAGLYQNAEEFRDRFTRALNAALASI